MDFLNFWVTGLWGGPDFSDHFVLVRIPEHSDYRFRRKPDSDSGGEPITLSVRAGTLQGS